MLRAPGWRARQSVISRRSSRSTKTSLHDSFTHCGRETKSDTMRLSLRATATRDEAVVDTNE